MPMKIMTILFSSESNIENNSESSTEISGENNNGYSNDNDNGNGSENPEENVGTEQTENGNAEETENSGAANVDTGFCVHHTEHTTECGYSENAPCGYVCRICPIQKLIAALPDTVTEDNAADVRA